VLVISRKIFFKGITWGCFLSQSLKVSRFRVVFVVNTIAKTKSGKGLETVLFVDNTHQMLKRRWH